MRHTCCTGEIKGESYLTCTVTAYLRYCFKCARLPQHLSTLGDSLSRCLCCFGSFFHSFFDFLPKFCPADLFQSLTNIQNRTSFSSMTTTIRVYTCTCHIYLFDRLWNVSQLLPENLGRLHCFRLYIFLGKDKKSISRPATSLSDRSSACGQILTYFLRACFNASDSSSFLASSRNFLMFSFISLLLFSSCLRLSKNSPRKPLRPPPRSPDKYLTWRRADWGTLKTHKNPTRLGWMQI